MAVPCFLCAQMPAHVVIRVTAGASPETDLYVDAFHRRVMDWGGLASFIVLIRIWSYYWCCHGFWLLRSNPLRK